jgi:hypothetical protein
MVLLCWTSHSPYGAPLFEMKSKQRTFTVSGSMHSLEDDAVYLGVLGLGTNW